MELSVVIPCYKSEALIARTVRSVLLAGVEPQNVFVVEDGVFDNTEAIMKTFPNVSYFKYNDNKGAPYARNMGLAKVSTKYVMFVDSDDFVSDDLITGLWDTAEQNNSDITFGPWRFDGERIRQGKLRIPPSLAPTDWVFHWINRECVPTCSVLWRTERVRNLGGWDERLKKNQDGELAVRGLLNVTSIAVSEIGFSTYWQHESSNRVSDAAIGDRLFAADVIYSQVLDLVARHPDGRYDRELAKFCIKQAWRAEEAGDDRSYQWIERARELGYRSSGYNNNTIMLSTLFGFRSSVAIRKKGFSYVRKLVLWR